MDVQAWLQKTADRAPPDGSDLGIPAFLAHPNNDTDRPALRKYHSKRKRASSDSSIVAPRVTKRPHRRDAHAPSTGGTRLTERSPANPRGKRSSGVSVTGDSESEAEEVVAPAKTYERRARHKTKADRYEPKAKKKKSKQDERKEKPLAKRCKARRIGNGGRTADLVQKFTLKNGPPKDRRLTLRAEKAGLFKHGRSSEQKPGRGAGLPDLVFNEMRFLQRPKEHQDEGAKEPQTKRSRKKDRKREQQEEISAYFAEKRPKGEAVAKADRNDVDHPTQQDERRRDRSPSRGRHGTRTHEGPPLELPGKAFLGFGSRGARPSSRCSRSTTPLSWSESQRRSPSVHDVQGSRSPRRTHHGRIGRQSRQDGKHGRRKRACDERLPYAPNNSKGLRDYTRTQRDKRMPSSAPTYEQTKPTKRASIDQEQMATRTKETSNITLPSVQRPPRQRSKDDLEKDRMSQHSGHTSDILQVRLAVLDDPGTKTLAGEPPAEDQPGHQANSSSPTIKLLRQARDAIRRQDVPVKAAFVPQADLPNHFDDHVSGRHDAAPQARSIQGDPNAADPPPEEVQTLPSLSRQPAAFTSQRRQPQPCLIPPNTLLQLEPWQVHPREEINAEIEGLEDEMLDNGDMEATCHEYETYGPVPTSLVTPNEVTLSSRFGRASLSFDFASHHATSVRGMTPFRTEPRGVLTLTQGRGMFSVGSERGIADNLAGFWKPHQLC